jgi:hypothetical protein
MRGERGRDMPSLREATNSALDVAREALGVAEASLPQYSHKNSQKTYTLWQLFAVLMVRRFLGLDLRRTEQLVKDWSDLREAIRLTTGVPDHTTLCRAEHKLLKKGVLTG